MSEYISISIYVHVYTLCICACRRAHEHGSPSLALPRQCQGHQLSKSLAAEQRSPLRTKDRLDAPSPVKDQVGGTVAARNARLTAGTDLIPVVTGLDTSGATGVVHSPVLALGGCTALLGLPVDADALALTGPGVRQEGLAVAVFMDWTLTHVCHTGPVESSIVHC